MLSNFLGILVAVVLFFGAGIAAFVWGKHKEKKKRERYATPERRTKEAGEIKAEKNREALIRLAVSLKKQAENAEAEIVYAKFFGRIAEPTQKLFALAEGKTKTDYYEEILAEEIISPIREAVRRYQVQFKDGELFLPVPQGKEEQEIFDRLKGLAENDLEKTIRNGREEIERAKRYEIPKNAVKGAAGCIHSLIETPIPELDPKRLQTMADEIRKAFIQSGVYPLHRDDERLRERPDLRALFIKVRGKAPIFPGLFIEVDNKLQPYGDFHGTCPREEG